MKTLCDLAISRTASLLLALLGIVALEHVHALDQNIKLDFERLAGIFATPETPIIKEKPWVIVDTGPENFQSNLDGWLIEENAKGLVLLDWRGELHYLRKPTTNEKRPAIQTSENGGFTLNLLRSADHTVVWQIHVSEYMERSKKFLEDGRPKDKGEDKNFTTTISQRFDLADYVVDSARHAHFAHQLGNDDQAMAHYAHALAAQKQYEEMYVQGHQGLPEFVANRVATCMYNQAVAAGHLGTSRKELQKQWEKIAALPLHKYREEAAALIKGYQGLMDEDTQWVEPDAKTIATMTVDQKIGYWIYHLRDLDIAQVWNPGSCNVLEDFRPGTAEEAVKKPNAAVELRRIGLAAIPQLIEHMDDARPTRCEGHWRWYWPEGHYLLRYGDCCQQIFEAITEHSIFDGKTTESYPIHDGAGKQCKEKAEQWWLEVQRKKTNSK